MHEALVFGPFRVDTVDRILFRDGEPSALGPRAVALLGLLLARAGQPVSKAALIDAAWPGRVVEESNLSVQVAAIRRVLAACAGGRDWIETLPRRGYRYVGPPVAPNAAHRAADGIDTAGAPVATAARPTPDADAPPLPEQPSIAVLPFARLGDDAAPANFADGMVDDIVTGLSRIHGLFVVGRASTARYADGPVDPAQAGRALGVRYLLQGSVRRAAERLRVGVQLVDAASGAHAWAERYDREFGDLFALQDEIALSVVGAIAPSLQRAERERVRRRRPDRLDAYALVLRAQADVDSGMPAQVTRALALLERAIALEPGYALAHGYAAMGHHCLFLRAGLQAAERDASVHHAREALVHGRDDAQALTLAAFSIGMDGHDHAAAFTALDAALALSPSSALSYILGSVMAGWQGQAERAIDWSARGLRLSPFDPWAFAAHDAQAMGRFHLGQYEQAAQAAYRSVQANPAHSITYVQLAAALAKLGRTDEARAAAARVLELQPGFRYRRQFAGVACAPALAESLGDALRGAGLPE